MISRPFASGIEDADGWWQLPSGAMNTICDVPGVTVGHETIHEGSIHTGVTAILPHRGNLFREKVRAGAAVLNGFGKSIGLMQVEELGELETPILLTNTFGVGACATALITDAIAVNPDIGGETTTVNPVVCECNDGWFNNIQALAVTPDTARAALAASGPHFTQGCVGAGSGMRTFGFPGGIGSSSRIVTLSGQTSFTVGVLTLANFGAQADLRIKGKLFRERIPPESLCASREDKGSVIFIIATDAPLDARQLNRLCRRTAAALGRLGSAMGHGSGDIALGFSTGVRIPHDDSDRVTLLPALHESTLNAFFPAVVESAEEAVLNAMWHGIDMVGRDGDNAASLRNLSAGRWP